MLGSLVNYEGDYMAQPKKRVYKRYFTKDKLEKINPQNIKAYDKYLKSNIIKNKDVKETTYRTYQNYFNQFLVYLSEEWENVYILDEEMLENAVDIIEGFIVFLQDTLGNNKKVINTKISAISSYYIWAMKRRIIDNHPFDKRLDRMKMANEEKLINHYFLNDEEIKKITKTIRNERMKPKGKYDIQDDLIWNIMIDSANRAGAIHRLTWSSLNMGEMIFEEIREKRGKIVDVPFTEYTQQILMEWKRIRQDGFDNMKCDSIFIVKYKGEYKSMSSTSIYMRVRKIGHILGLEDLHPHCLRKTTINRVVEKTGDLSLAQELANHNDISTTKQFYTKPKSKAELRDKLKKMMQK